MTVGKILLALLALWLVITVIGVIIKGLFWLFVIGLVLFGFTLATSARRNGFLRR